VTSGEAKDPVKAIPAALRTMLLRLFLFYILALTIVVAFIPWTETGAKVVEQSPFVKVFAQSGVAYAAGIMNFVVMSAALSSMNTNVYLCSRMLFSLSRGNYAPQFLGRLGRAHTPIGAIIVSGAGILIAAAISMFTPFAVQLSASAWRCSAPWSSGSSFSSAISASAAAYGKAALPVRMPLFPWLQLIALGLLVGILVTMGWDQEFWRISWIVGVPWLVLISIAYFVWRPRREAKAASLVSSTSP
jgi:L-asparagine transporter-like permease